MSAVDVEYLKKARGEEEYEAISHPPHYVATGIEAIDVIEEWDLGFHLGNVVKYISRMGRKPGSSELEDLKKAEWYISRLVKRLEKK